MFPRIGGNTGRKPLACATTFALIAVGLLEIFFHGDRRFYRIF